jgi:ureidoglycolate dehydrogenase (NAD+)
VVIDVNAVAPREEFDRRLHALIAEIHAAPTAAGVERVLLPGEREWANWRRAQAAGIDLPPDVRDKLRESAALTGVTFNEP